MEWAPVCRESTKSTFFFRSQLGSRILESGDEEDGTTQMSKESLPNIDMGRTTGGGTEGGVTEGLDGPTRPGRKQLYSGKGRRIRDVERCFWYMRREDKGDWIRVFTQVYPV